MCNDCPLGSKSSFLLVSHHHYLPFRLFTSAGFLWCHCDCICSKKAQKREKKLPIILKIDTTCGVLTDLRSWERRPGWKMQQLYTVTLFWSLVQSMNSFFLEIFRSKSNLLEHWSILSSMVHCYVEHPFTYSVLINQQKFISTFARWLEKNIILFKGRFVNKWLWSWLGVFVSTMVS